MAATQVIIAEDEAELRGLIGEMLTGIGVGVAEAADGIEAMQLLKDNRGISLLLSDVKMPHMGGYELVEAALSLRPELKIVMMTAYAADQPPPAAMRAREIRTLIKPFNPDRLRDLVSEMLSRP